MFHGESRVQELQASISAYMPSFYVNRQKALEERRKENRK
jgi:hypothetical protein